MKTRSHEIIVTVNFDKPTTRAHAVASFRDNVHGTFYPTSFFDDEPEIMLIRGVRSKPKGQSK